MATDTQVQIVREAPEIEAYKIGLLESAKQLADQPITLPEQQVAAMSGLQQQAISAASPATGGIGGYQPYLTEAGYTMGEATPFVRGAYGEAADVIRPSFGTATSMYGLGAMAPDAAMMASYMNPYQQAIQDEINRSYDISQTQAQAQAVGQPGGPSAFGGSRAAVLQAENERNRASALAQAQAQNFLQAQQAAQQQLGRTLQAAQGIGSLGLQAGQTLGQLGLQSGEQLSQLGLRQAALGESAQKQALTDIQTQFELGKQQQGQQQAELEAKRQSDLSQLYEPYQRYGFLSDIYKGAPTTQQTIATATSPSVSPAQQFLGLGIAGLSAAGGAAKAGLFG